VLAAGAWSGLPDWLAGSAHDAPVPVRPVKGQTVRLRDPAGPGLIERVVRFDGGYLVPRRDGRYVLGGTVEEQGFDTSATAGGVYELLREAREIVPGVTELDLEEVAVGLRPGSPDNLPIVGRGDRAGLVWATGHYRNGILQAPLTAELVTAAISGSSGAAAHTHEDAVAGAARDGLDLAQLAASCDPARFASADGSAQTNGVAEVAA
jgi:glycine oxidase